MNAAATDVSAALAAALLLVAAVAGGTTFTGAVLVLCVLALLLLHTAFSATGHTPVLLAAAIAAVGAPLWAARSATPNLEAVPALVAASLLAAFALLIVGRRRHGITIALGATAACALVVGLGGAALVALRQTNGGFRWVLAVLLLTALPEVAAAAAERVRPDAAAAVPVRIVTLAVVGGALLAVANPPLGVVAVVVLAVVAGATALGGDMFVEAAALESATGQATGSVAVRWSLALLGAAPLAFLLERTLQV